MLNINPPATAGGTDLDPTAIPDFEARSQKSSVSMNYMRRTIITGTSVFFVSVLAGIAFRCWHEYRTPILRPFTVSDLLFVTTVGPLAGAVLAGPLTVLVLITFASWFSSARGRSEYGYRSLHSC